MDGVMVGREAYQNPSILAHVDHVLFDNQLPVTNAVAAVKAMYPYIEKELSQGTYLGHITRHMLGIFQGIPGARQWRRHLSENMFADNAGFNVFEEAVKKSFDRTL